MKKMLLALLAAILVLSFFAGRAAQTAPASSPAPTGTPAPTPAPEAEGAEDPAIIFTTTDREGNTWDETAFQGHSLTMLNFWEPWCGPCVGEMADIQKLSEDYTDKGLQVLGIYSTPGMEADVDAVLEKTGVKYPILHDTEDFDLFESGYVPTTVFVDAGGCVVDEQFYVGSRSYEAWEALVLELLG